MSSNSMEGETRVRSFECMGGSLQGEFTSNTIRTTKYTTLPWQLDFFVYKILWEQFQRKANLYFFIIGCLQAIPGVSPTGRFTTLMTLAAVLTFSALKSIYEDYRRYRKDAAVNAQPALVARREFPDDWSTIPFSEVRVGDLLLISNVPDEDGYRFNDLPCDIAVLATSDSDGIAYVETANLDGETNLKPRQAHEATQLPGNIPEANLTKCAIDNFSGSNFFTEQPNNSLYTFAGRYISRVGGVEIHLSPSQMMYRGSKMRKVRWAIGVAVFTGRETKMAMNARATPHKASKVEKLVNWLLIAVLILNVTLVVVSAVGGIVVVDSGSWYLGDQRQLGGLDRFLVFLTFVILYNNFIPISLYVTLEGVRFLQGYLIAKDAAMYFGQRDMPASARTTDINEELGQVRHVFSDKTGTLTCNVMTFMKFCVADGAVYGEGLTEIGRAAAQRQGKPVEDKRPPEVLESDIPFYDERISDGKWLRCDHKEEVRNLFLALAMCHTVVVDDEEYEAESPDEAALVKFAAKMGIVFVSRSSTSLVIDFHGETVTYDILGQIDFDSDRKRMTVVLKSPSGEGLVLCKGADNVMLPRISLAFEPQVSATASVISAFGAEGLRTLVFTQKHLDAATATRWGSKFADAKKIIGNNEARRAAITALGDEMECDLELIGASGIEDKLQDGVPVVLEALQAAGIRVWMLTGDKMETAINIGFACSLLHNEMQRVDLDDVSEEETNQRLSELIAQRRESNGKIDQAVIIEGHSLGRILDNDNLAALLVKAADGCRSLVCCRVSPTQKAQVVELVRKHDASTVTLAIGDGANDVPMIQAAHVGIGISGFEGQQAANSSDYAIGQFRFLYRLVFVHGRACYRRTTLLIKYFFYKNATLVLTQFWYAIFNLFTGQSLYEQWVLTGFNVAFASLPIVAVGILDRDVLDTDNIRLCPQLYTPGYNSELLNVRWFVGWLLMAVIDSCLMVFGAVIAWGYAIGNGGVPLGLEGVGHTLYAVVIVIVNARLALHAQSFNWLTHATLATSIVALPLYYATFGGLPLVMGNTELYRFVDNVIFQQTPWLMFIIITAMVLLPGFWYKVAIYNIMPVSLLTAVQLHDSRISGVSMQLAQEIRDEGNYSREISGVESTSIRGRDDASTHWFSMSQIFSSQDAEETINDRQNIFMQFVDPLLEDEFLSSHIGNLIRYKIGLGMTAVATLLLVGVSLWQLRSGAKVAEVVGWAIMSIAAWGSFALITLKTETVRRHIHFLMVVVLFVGLSGMMAANFAASQREADTHPVTAGVLLLGLFVVVRPPFVQALQYVLIAMLCFVSWYQVYRVQSWGVVDLLIRFVELVIVSMTSLVALAIAEHFLRAMFVSQRHVQLAMRRAGREESRSLVLLGNVLPAALVNELRTNRRNLSDFSVTYSTASLLHSDIVQFTKFSSTREPHAVVEMLNAMFTLFDACAKDLTVEKIKTIGDAYVCAAGIPVEIEDHGVRIVEMGMAMLTALSELNGDFMANGTPVDIAIRIGAATGPVHAGVIGMEKVCYDVFGSVVTESERMESTGWPNRLQVSPQLYSVANKLFIFETLAEDSVMDMDGTGSLSTAITRYFLSGRCDPAACSRGTVQEHAVMNVLVNDLKREDIYGFLQDEDVERQEILEKYSNINADVDTIHLNFKHEVLESQFRLYLRVLASTRFVSEAAQATFLFFISFVLISLDVTAGVTHWLSILILVAAIVHLVGGVVVKLHKDGHLRCCRCLPKSEAEMQEEDQVVDDARRISVVARRSGASILEHRSAHERADRVVSAMERSVKVLGSATEKGNSICTPVRVWAAASAATAYLMPIALMVGILRELSGSNAIPVFVVLSSNVYVVSFMHLRLWGKVATSVIHLLVVSAGFFFLTAVEQNFALTKDGGNYIAICLNYLLCLLSVYTTEESVRHSFAASKQVVFQNAEITAAVALCDKLLNNVLPSSIVQRLKKNPDKAIVDEVSEASVLFLYFEGLMAAETTASDTSDIVATLNEFLWMADTLALHHGVEKIKTTPYLVVSGCPVPVPDHCNRLITFSRDVMKHTEWFNRTHGTSVRIRAGIHTGKVTAGVLGSTKFLYDVFGDTVNFAARLTSSALTDTIQLSEAAVRVSKFPSVDRGSVELKGKGQQQVFTVDHHSEEIRRIPVAPLANRKDLPAGFLNNGGGEDGSGVQSQHIQGVGSPHVARRHLLSTGLSKIPSVSRTTGSGPLVRLPTLQLSASFGRMSTQPVEKNGADIPDLEPVVSAGISSRRSSAKDLERHVDSPEASQKGDASSREHENEESQPFRVRDS